MNAQIVSYSVGADHALVAKVEAARAKLKPCCMRCRKNLTKRDTEARLCRERSACTVRAILLAGKPVPRQFRPGVR